MGSVISVNLAVPRPDPANGGALTGIDKRPTTVAVAVRAPAEKGSGGLRGDQIYDVAGHGGPDQAVYAFAQEDLDEWAHTLDRTLSPGMFGENLTTSGVDVTGALVGERWRIGGEVVLEVTRPRIPCKTFAAWMGYPDWVKRFTRRAAPGAYLRVITPGEVRAGDPLVVTDRPDHDVTIGLVFRALTLEPELLPRLLAAEALAEEVRERVTRRLSGSPVTRSIGATESS